MLFTMRETYVDRNPKSHIVLGIAPVAIIDRQLPFEYTITSRSTDVVVMALPNQNINHSAFRSMFEREKLSGNNFNDWFRQLKLVLRVEKKMYVIKQSLPAAPAANYEANVLLEWNAIFDAYNEVACLILGSMTPELHRQFENSSPYDMIKRLKAMFEKQAGVERSDLIQTFHACKQEEGKPVAAYVIQMKGYVDQLECLGYMLPQDLVVGLILNGLTKDFAGFVRNYNMHNMGKTIGELHAMLIEYEKGLPKKVETPQVMMIKGGKIQKANKKSLKAKGKGKANGKGKDKQVYIPKPKNPKPSAKEHPAKDDACHHCKEMEARKLKQGALYLYVGNGVRMQVKAIGSYNLVLPNDLVICLDNYHYAPSILRGIVLVHRLVENGFVQCFTDFGILVSKNNVHYFNAIPSNGIYEIDMHNLVPNVNSIYNVSTKRAKHNLDSTYLWHCRLAHISKKRIEKPQHEGLLKSTDDESFDQCVSCLSGKMTRKSFHHVPKGEFVLLGIITYDVLWNCLTAYSSIHPTQWVSLKEKSYFVRHVSIYDESYNSAFILLDYALASAKRLFSIWSGDDTKRKRWVTIFTSHLKNKIVVARYAEFFEKNLITQEFSGRAGILKNSDYRYITCLKSLAKIPMEVKVLKHTQEEEISIRRSERTLQSLCVANLSLSANNDGIYPCKDPKFVTANDFFFSHLQLPPATTNERETIVSEAFDFHLPGLNTLGMSMALTDIGPGSPNNDGIYPCKDPKFVTANDFFFSHLQLPPSTTNEREPILSQAFDFHLLEMWKTLIRVLELSSCIYLCRFGWRVLNLDTWSRSGHRRETSMYDDYIGGQPSAAIRTALAAQAPPDHPLEQVIGEPSRPVLTRNQLRSDGDMCMYALTVSTMEPKNVKEAMTDPAWIESMQEEASSVQKALVYKLLLLKD
ncbi:retrotransposon protein, putative, ty1-copia subclass [Tanacetum coccineum]